ncbi:MAG: hypothetical protein ACYTG4_06025, partial [Planctomycetota bacterium]
MLILIDPPPHPPMDSTLVRFGTVVATRGTTPKGTGNQAQEVHREYLSSTALAILRPGFLYRRRLV